MKNIFSLYDFLIYIFLPFGQLFARINLLNGSMDKSWLILLCFIPFIIIPILLKFSIQPNILFIIIGIIISNIIPLMLIEFGKINIQQNQPSQYIDKYIMFPIIVKILIALIFTFKFNNTTKEYIVKFIIIFGSILFSLLTRHYSNNNNKLTSNSLLNNKTLTIIVNSIFIYTMSNLSQDVFADIKLKLLDISSCSELTTILDLLFSIFGLFISYIFINLFNDNNNDINNYCANKIYLNNANILIITLFYYYNKNFI